jgi:hypothetical protein
MMTMLNTTPSPTTSRSGLRNRKAIAFLIAAMVIATVAFASCGGSGGGGGTNLAKFCKDLDASITKIDQGGGGAPPGKTELASTSADMRKLAAEAPAAIKGDLNTTAEFFQKASEHGIGSVDAATTSAADTAGENINDFATTNCESQSP